MDRRTKDVALDVFAKRYPVAGETVQALIDCYGSVDDFIEDLEGRGYDRELYGWMTARKPASMKLKQIRELIPHDMIERVSAKTGVSEESVELQVAQYLPRFFKTMSEDDGMGFLH